MTYTQSTPAPLHLIFGRRLSHADALEHVEALERGWAVKNYLMLAVGVPSSLLGPLVAACVVWIFSARGGDAPPFLAVFLWCCVVVTPVMYILAWSMRGSLSEKFVEETDDFNTPFTYGIRGRAAAAFILFDILLFAPKMVIFAARRMHARRRLGEVNLSRVAEAVSVLASADGGISPGKLLRPGEGGDVLGLIFDYLVLHDQIGIAKAGDRVWMDGDVKKKLLPQPA